MNAKPPMSLQELFQRQGFIHVAEDSILDGIQQRSGFQFLHSFKQSWNDLPLDNHLRDEGKYRFRRYAVFNVQVNNAEDNEVRQLPIEAHYQSREYNNENGGYQRYFSELSLAVAESPILKELIEWNIELISTGKQKKWRVQCHQFRICATPLEAGKPSPEGIHQDGADYVFIMLLDRENVSGASNTIHNKSGGVIYEATLKQSGEAILIDDKRHWHGVSKVLQDDKNLESHRDVLVLTFHKEA